VSSDPVEPQLFDLLDEYTERIRDGRVGAERSVRRSSQVITFLQSFYEQLFASCFDLELQAFDDQSKRLVVEMRHDQDVSKGLVPIVSGFELLCDLYPDVIGASYGGGSTATFQRFHKRFLPGLLRSVTVWARDAGHAALAGRAEQSGRRLRDALKDARW
jgi:hypothetical protein